jgi:phenylalanyl-tRNA synthetase alpha chain
MKHESLGRSDGHRSAMMFHAACFMLHEKGMSETNELEKMIAEAMLKMSTAGEDDLNGFEISLLGRKGELNRLLAILPSLPPEKRASFGAAANAAKIKISDGFARRRRELAAELASELAKREKIDVTEPGATGPVGHKHLVSAAIEEMALIFERIGFRRERYNEADYDYYAFEALNLPKNHPARDDWETFFLEAEDNKRYGRLLLTPHTSNSQIHEMERRKPPIRMVAFGKSYRRQADVTHLTMFHQFEGFVVDRGINLTHLKGVMDHFAKNYFGTERKTRLRPHHFKFTEPSFEVDISCDLCNGTGWVANGAGQTANRTPCRVCKSGWLELGGAGMVHPNVLTAGGINPKEWSGLAFGWGVERTMMMRSGMRIPDIRMIYDNDFRFLKQF